LRKKPTRNNRIQLYLFNVLLLALFLSANGIFAAAKAPVYTDKDKTFTGTVTPVLSALVRYGFNDTDRGIVVYSTRVGQFVYGPVTDSKGKVIKKGDLLIKLDSPYHKQEVQTAKANLKEAQANLTYAEQNHKRALQLGDKDGAISKAQYWLYIYTYNGAVENLKSMQKALIVAQALYDLINERAVFDGVVTKTYMNGNLLNNEPPVLQLAALNPMGVKIELDHSIAKKLNNLNNSVTVYPVRGDKKAQGILFNMTKLTDDGIMLAVENYLIPANLGNLDIPVVNNGLPVLKLYSLGEAGKPLAVPNVSLAKDSKGTYVWQLVGNKDLQSGKGLSKIYKAKKAYVKPGQLIKRINNNIDYRSLDSSTNLSEYDLVLVNDNLPAGLKDNDQVCLSDNQYLFMPGDTVKIEIN
jgi:hypothetical protein